jgi:serine/threonine-protein kinase
MTSSEAKSHLHLVEGVPPSIPPPDPLIGRTLDGRYRIESVLGEGGMGLVYRARHAVLQKPLAIKVLRPEVSRDAEVLSRFQQEAQSASAIGNQHIIDISDFGTLPDGSTYFVMEFLDGRSLTGAIETSPEQGGAPMDPARVVHIAKQLCDALGAAHERSIVHRDMKPDNVFLIKRGGDIDFVKVLDFGIAKVGGSSSKLTKAGQVFGTPHYMSPEQCAGSAVDQRTDIYALGVILYEMACGRVPFDADNLMGILTKHMYEQPIPPHELPPPVKVPPGLESIILKCLAKSTDARYQTMIELREDLTALEQGMTPRAVIDGVDRSLSGVGTMPGRDPTGRVVVPSMIRMGVDAHEPPAKSKMPMFAGIGAALLLLVGGGIAAMMAMGSPDETAAPESTQTVVPSTEIVQVADPGPGSDSQEAPPGDEGEATAAAGSQQAAEAAEDPPTATPQVAGPSPTIEIQTDPEGAEVWRGDELLGNTPYSLPRPASGERIELSLQKSGYQTQSAAVSSLTAPTVRIALTAEQRRSTSRRTERHSTSSSTPPAAQQAPTSGRSHGGSEVIDPWR